MDDAVDMPRTVAMILDELIERLSTGTPAPSAIERATQAAAELSS